MDGELFRLSAVTIVCEGHNDFPQHYANGPMGCSHAPWCMRRPAHLEFRGKWLPLTLGGQGILFSFELVFLILPQVYLG